VGAGPTSPRPRRACPSTSATSPPTTRPSSAPWA